MSMETESYLILIKSIHRIEIGCIFKYINNEKLTSYDTKVINSKQINSIIKSCETLDKRTALLLQSLNIGNRIKLYRDSIWNELAALDIGDKCFYLMGNNEVSCCITCKQLSKNGIIFTVLLENDTKIDTPVDRIKCVKKMETTLNPTKNENDEKHENQVSEKIKTSNIISTYEEMNKCLDYKRRRETLSIDVRKKGITNSYDFWRRKTRDPTYFDTLLSNSTSSNCSCMNNIFRKTDNLPLNFEEKEKFFNNLFLILPNVFNDHEGRCNLHWASYYLVVDSVKLFITDENCRNKQDKLGNTPLHLAVSTPLYLSKETTYKKNLETILRLFSTNNCDLNIKNNQNDTPLTIAFKSGEFNILEILIENSPIPIILSNHFLSENISILECLIKMKKFTLSKLCFNKSSYIPSENNVLLKAVFHSIEKGYFNLSHEIIEKCDNKNAILPDGEILLTKLFKEKSITSENIIFLLNFTTFDYNQSNKFGEYPLLLACKKLFLDPVKFLLSKMSITLPRMDECLDSTITSYTNFYIDSTFKPSKPTNQTTALQLKSVVFEITELLIKNGATIHPTNKEIHETIETCLDQDFAKAVKHLCRMNTLLVQNKSGNSLEKLSTTFPIENKNECSICMDRMIDCSFSCGHTYCSKCAENLYQCPTCRKEITDKRKIFLS